MRRILLPIILIFSISLIAASYTNLGTYEKDDCVNLIQLCDDCTFNNITSIVQPNGTSLPLIVGMTKRGTDYNYTFCQTDSVGTYYVNGFGDDGGEDTVWAYDFEITNTGKTSGNFTFPTYLILILVGICYLLMLFGIRNQEFVPTVLGSFLLFAVGIWLWTNGLGDLGPTDLVSRMFASINLGIGGWVSMKSIYENLLVNM